MSCGIVVEKREARQVVHQAKSGHVRAHAAFEMRIKVGAELHFDLAQFVFVDAFFANFAS